MAKRPQIQTRLPPDLHAAIEEDIVRRRHTSGKNLTISEWLREAAAEKMDRLRAAQSGGDVTIVSRT